MTAVLLAQMTAELRVAKKVVKSAKMMAVLMDID